MKNLTISCKTGGLLLLFLACSGLHAQDRQVSLQLSQLSTVRIPATDLSAEVKKSMSPYRAADESDSKSKVEQIQIAKKMEVTNTAILVQSSTALSAPMQKLPPQSKGGI